MKRKGEILGTRIMGFWLKVGNVYEYYYGPVSSYIQYHRYVKGRTRKDRKNIKDYNE
jgi:hypothetical protein